MSEHPPRATTLRELLRCTQASLGAGPASVTDAERLIAAVSGRPRTALIAEPDAAVSAEVAEAVAELAARRADGEPLAYLLGSEGFWTLELAVRPGVLVPRPETETLVEVALALLPPDGAPRILDLGTGSGAVALALASERTDAEVTATEASDLAFEVARDNVLALERDVEVLMGPVDDWYLPVTARRFDLIVSNPPYVAEGDPALDPSVPAYEPHAALFAADDGSAGLRAIIAGAPQHLAAGGALALEHGTAQGALVRDLLIGAGFEQVATTRDHAGHERVTAGRLA